MTSDCGDWLVPGRLLVCPYPGQPDGLDGLVSMGIRRIINLTRRRHDPATLAAFGIEEISLPVRDFTAPSARVLEAAIAAIAESHAAGDAVAIHCRGGLGRTGTVAAAWLTTQGLSAEEAIGRIRTVRPGSIETRRQERAVHEFAAQHPSWE